MRRRSRRAAPDRQQQRPHHVHRRSTQRDEQRRLAAPAAAGRARRRRRRQQRCSDESEEGAPPAADDGRLGRAGALGARLARLGGRVPVLLTSGGAADIVEASGWTDLPPSTRRVTFGGSGHLPFIEQNEQFLVALLDFLDEVDGVETNRELKFADPLKTIKELT